MASRVQSTLPLVKQVRYTHGSGQATKSLNSSAGRSLVEIQVQLVCYGWMDETLHHFETIGSHRELLVGIYKGIIRNPGFSGATWISSIHSMDGIDFASTRRWRCPDLCTRSWPTVCGAAWPDGVASGLSRFLGPLDRKWVGCLKKNPEAHIPAKAQSGTRKQKSRRTPVDLYNPPPSHRFSAEEAQPLSRARRGSAPALLHGGFHSLTGASAKCRSGHGSKSIVPTGNIQMPSKTGSKTGGTPTPKWYHWF